MPAQTIASCTTSGGAHGIASAMRCRRQRADQQRAFAADDDQAELRRQRRAQRGQDQRRRARQRVLPGEPGAERALVHVEVEVERVLAEQRDEDAEHDERADQRRARDQDVFDGRAVSAGGIRHRRPERPRPRPPDPPRQCVTKSLRSRPRPDSPSSRARDPSGRGRCRRRSRSCPCCPRAGP